MGSDVSSISFGEDMRRVSEGATVTETTRVTGRTDGDGGFYGSGIEYLGYITKAKPVWNQTGVI